MAGNNGQTADNVSVTTLLEQLTSKFAITLREANFELKTSLGETLKQSLTEVFQEQGNSQAVNTARLNPLYLPNNTNKIQNNTQEVTTEQREIKR